MYRHFTTYIDGTTLSHWERRLSLITRSTQRLVMAAPESRQLFGKVTLYQAIFPHSAYQLVQYNPSELVETIFFGLALHPAISDHLRLTNSILPPTETLDHQDVPDFRKLLREDYENCSLMNDESFLTSLRTAFRLREERGTRE